MITWNEAASSLIKTLVRPVQVARFLCVLARFVQNVVGCTLSVHIVLWYARGSILGVGFLFVLSEILAHEIVSLVENSDGVLKISLPLIALCFREVVRVLRHVLEPPVHQPVCKLLERVSIYPQHSGDTAGAYLGIVVHVPQNLFFDRLV